MPCANCPRCDGVQEKKPFPGTDLTERNWLAYKHYKECRATLRFPDDPIVRRNAAIIRAVEDANERNSAFRAAAAVGGALAGLARPRR